MDGPMLDAYHPQAVEAAWDSWWTKSGFYTANAEAAAAAGEEGRFVMVIPPPNVTGSLHIGHALTDSIEDAMTRWNRMCGRPTLWLPGTDHAGIATQSVVEKRLLKESGVTRHMLGRDAFLAEVWKWKEQYGNRIYDQMRHMGVSVDWSRARFTMDDQLSKAVTEAFVRLHKKKLIYRDTRLVNWCCALKTAISDIEVEYMDFEKRTRIPVPGHDPKKLYEFGCITSFAYKVIDSAEEIVVATTRPETMLGDTAVAVHPADERYKHLHGKLLQHPFFPERRIQVITDGELVDMAFGTGAVKITPAHDPNDYKCGKKHGLQFITVFNEEGKINDAGGEFKGLMRFDAREAVLKALNDKGLLRGKADNKMRIGICSRSGDVIEPLIKPQWYVDCKDMAKRSTDAVRSGDLKIVPGMDALATLLIFGFA
jgi:valyl-tRNA synthetase